MVDALAREEAAVDEGPASADRTRAHVGDDRRGGAEPVVEEALEGGNMGVEVDTEHARSGVMWDVGEIHRAVVFRLTMTIQSKDGDASSRVVQAPCL